MTIRHHTSTMHYRCLCGNFDIIFDPFLSLPAPCDVLYLVAVAIPMLIGGACNPMLRPKLGLQGPDRVMAESNWFVSEAVGDAYDKSFGLVLQACKRAGYDQAQTDKVFAGNAKRVYSL